MSHLATLPHRGVIAIAGPDRLSFLQGLVSNDVSRTAPHQAVWAALLTAQGRYVAEFFILTDGDRLLLDAPRSAIPDLIKRLSRFRLRSQVEMSDCSAEFIVHAAWGDEFAPLAGTVSAPDPRLPHAGSRILAPSTLPDAEDAQAYLAHRLALGLPDHDDLEPEKTLLMEAGFGELNGIDWEKGCYMGQELTARTRYRGLVKRRLIPVNGDEALPDAGPIMVAGREIGEIRTALGARALAILRIDALDQPLLAGTIAIKPDIPGWMHLPSTFESSQP